MYVHINDVDDSINDGNDVRRGGGRGWILGIIRIIRYNNNIIRCSVLNGCKCACTMHILLLLLCVLRATAREVMGTRTAATAHVITHYYYCYYLRTYIIHRRKYDRKTSKN